MRITQDEVYQILDGQWRTEPAIRARVFQALGISLPDPSSFFAAQGRDMQRVTITSHLVKLVQEGYAECRLKDQLVLGRWVQRLQYRDPNMVERPYA